MQKSHQHVLAQKVHIRYESHCIGQEKTFACTKTVEVRDNYMGYLQKHLYNDKGSITRSSVEQTLQKRITVPLEDK